MQNIDLVTDNGKAVDVVSAWLSGAIKAEFGFIVACHAAIDQFEKGNRDALAKLLTVVNGKTAKRIRRKEGDKLAFSVPLKRVMDSVMPNVKAKFDGMSDFGVSWSVEKKEGQNSICNQDAFAKLEYLAQVNADPLDIVEISAFGKTFKEAFPAKKVEKKPVVVDEPFKKAAALTIAKQLKAKGLTVGDIADYLRAAMA